MCNRYARKKTFADYRQELRGSPIPLVSPAPESAPNDLGPGEVAPTDPAPIFRRTEKGDGLEMVLARWWFIPENWKRSRKEFKLTTFNCRIEGAAQSHTFKQAYAARRCLIPVDGWFEYTGEKKPLTRWLIERRDRGTILLAGLWSEYTDPEHGPTNTFTMMMQPAFPPVDQIHDRAPILLDHAQACDWLDPSRPVDSILKASHGAELNVTKG